MGVGAGDPKHELAAGEAAALGTDGEVVKHSTPSVNAWPRPDGTRGRVGERVDASKHGRTGQLCNYSTYSDKFTGAAAQDGRVGNAPQTRSDGLGP